MTGGGRSPWAGGGRQFPARPQVFTQNPEGQGGPGGRAVQAAGRARTGGSVWSPGDPLQDKMHWGKRAPHQLEDFHATLRLRFRLLEINKISAGKKKLAWPVADEITCLCWKLEINSLAGCLEKLAFDIFRVVIFPPN